GIRDFHVTGVQTCALPISHSDDKGLVLPPNLAPNQVVIVPIYKTEEQFEEISKLAKLMISDLRARHISVKYDDRTTLRPGAKFADRKSTRLNSSHVKISYA